MTPPLPGFAAAQQRAADAANAVYAAAMGYHGTALFPATGVDTNSMTAPTYFQTLAEQGFTPDGQQNALGVAMGDGTPTDSPAFAALMASTLRDATAYAASMVATAHQAAAAIPPPAAPPTQVVPATLPTPTVIAIPANVHGAAGVVLAAIGPPVSPAAHAHWQWLLDFFGHTGASLAPYVEQAAATAAAQKLASLAKPS